MAIKQGYQIHEQYWYYRMISILENCKLSKLYIYIWRAQQDTFLEMIQYNWMVHCGISAPGLAIKLRMQGISKEI